MPTSRKRRPAKGKMTNNTRGRAFTFGSVRFRIRDVPDVLAEMKRLGYPVTDDDDELDGVWLPANSLILVSSKLGREQRASTIFHEMMHACGMESERDTLRYEIMMVPVLRRQGWNP